MKCMAISAALALGTLAGSAAVTAQEGERLASPALGGFVVGYQAANASQSIREEIPEGQTLETWSRMVTTQRFGGLAARATPEQYAGNVLAALPQRCPAARVTPASSLKVSGRNAVRFEVDCPAGTGGRRELFMFLAIAGRADMHVKQVALRGRATPQDLAWGRGLLGATVLCQPGLRQPACR